MKAFTYSQAHFQFAQANVKTKNSKGACLATKAFCQF
jgi:hypothetical protein